MITLAQDTHKQEVIHLWQTSFPDDSQEFINLYFEKKYKNENTLVYILDNKIVSCLQMLPYTINFYNQICNLSYISGAATLPDYQNKGIMGKLLSQSFAEMRKRGDIFTTLIPQEAWLTTFYEKYGYTTCFEYSLTPISLENDCFSDTFSVSELGKTHLQAAYDYYYRHCRQQNLFVLKSFDDFLVIWEELTLFSGSILVCYESEKICGICFCSVSSKNLIIKDLIADSEAIREKLLQFAMENYKTNIYLQTPKNTIRHCVLNLIQNLPQSPNNNAFNKEIPHQVRNDVEISNGMARILNVEKALQIYASFYNQLKINIKVQDNQIAENNGIFCLSNGNCYRKQDNLFDLEVDINLLTQLLFGYQTTNYPNFPQQHPYMSLMLE